MDVLVKWKDGTTNVVCTKELVLMKKRGKYEIGANVKMLYSRKWYYGTITATEENSSTEIDSDNRNIIENFNCHQSCEYSDCFNIVSTTCFQCSCFLCFEHFETQKSCLHHNQSCPSPNFDLNIEENEERIEMDCSIIEESPNFEPVSMCDSKNIQCCEYSTCSEEIFSSCHRCLCLLCYDHFINYASCYNHVINKSPSFNETFIPTNTEDRQADNNLQNCEFFACNNKVLSTCFQCTSFLCYEHYQSSCVQHGKGQQNNEEFLTTQNNDFETISNCSDVTAVLCESPSILQNLDEDNRMSQDEPLLFAESRAPEEYIVEGSRRETEYQRPSKKNKFKEAKLLRNFGKEYISPVTKKVVPERKIGSLCNIENCVKMGRNCYKFSEEQRENIFLAYYAMGDLQSQREFVVRFTDTVPVKQKTVGGESRRKNTNVFYLPLDGQKIQVCQKMFLSTLAISEKTFRTAKNKLKETGVVEKENRGGRRDYFIDKDLRINRMVKEHIDRFPRVESHYCRKDTSREYLSHNLSLKKMHQLFINEYGEKVSLSLYRKIFKTKNLSFHKPKKDECSLCITYREGGDETKKKLEEKYTQHIKEKEEVRKRKDECKKLAQENDKYCCASFDLQQVIYLPQCNESALFYKRRLANYNFTIYDIASKDCYCNVWNETVSKRGATEISTALFDFLSTYDRNGVEIANLFSDGCSGQNKNSVVAAMLLHFINNCQNIKEINLRFFCPFHGQSEGDSVHSAIATAMAKTGNIYVPSQLEPIIRLARKTPYIVKVYNHTDFKDFKHLSSKLKLLAIRKDENDCQVNWTQMKMFRVVKEQPTSLFFKTSHLDSEYRIISIKRTNINSLKTDIDPLYKETNELKISREKYNDLVSLCSGDTPLIRCPEHQLFYRSLNFHD